MNELGPRCDLRVNGRRERRRRGEAVRMTVHAATVADGLVLSRGALRVEISRRPFAIDVRRDGRRLVRGLGIWCADGAVADQFIQFTEGVIAAEELELARARRLRDVAEPLADGAELALRFDSGRRGRLRVTLPFDDTVVLELEADGAPLRQALAGTRAPRSTSPGSARATHCASTTPGARSSSAPTAPTPARTARRTCSRSAASRRATTRRRRGCSPRAATRVHVGGHGNGMRFDLGAERTTVSARSAAGPLRVELLTQPDARRAPAPLPARHRPAAGAARVGLRLLEVARRLRPPGRGRGRLPRLRGARRSRSTRSCSTRRGRRNTTPGSPTRTSSRTSRGWCARFATPACGPSCGSRRG